MINRKTEIAQLRKELLRFYAPNGNERCGFVLPHKIVEVTNVAPDPVNGFQVDPEDLIKFTETQKAWASWHTHPNYPSNLTGEDFRSFKAYPNLHHFIVGKNGVRCYKMDTGKKVLIEVLDE